MKTKLSFITAITAQISLLRMPLPTPGLVPLSPRLPILTLGESFTTLYCRVGSAFAKSRATVTRGDKSRKSFMAQGTSSDVPLFLFLLS